MCEKSFKPKVLVFVGYYLPGFKGGGPIKSVSNLVRELGDSYDFMIVTRDRDLSEAAPYEGIEVDRWQEIAGGGEIIYLSPSNLGLLSIKQILSDKEHDVIYLNGFFDPIFSIRPVWLCRYFGVSKAPILIAPRGEFSAGAIDIKRLKKLAYVGLCNLLNVYRGCVFQASSFYEMKDILRFVKAPEGNVHVAQNVPDASTPSRGCQPEFSKLKIVFLSRISPKKNLKFALRVLSLTKSQIEFHIYGPVEDRAYWSECESAMKKLPPNVDASYCGEVSPENVKKIFSEYDVFLFPTLGENYGHVIAESLLAGTPVLTSDQTPWRNMEKEGLGWDLPLSDESAYSRTIDCFAIEDAAERWEKRSLMREKVKNRLNSSDIISANKKLFSFLLDRT